jgi:hypothetical protein
MNLPDDRQVWNDILHYRSFDRMPIIHWQGWPETYDRWYQEGLPRDPDQEHVFLKSTPMHSHLHIDLELYPAFEEITIEETDNYRIFRQADGVIAQHWKNASCIPHFIDFTLRDHSSWPEYQKRLQPDPGRIPPDFQQKIDRARSSGAPIALATGSLIGWIRNWMGVENLSYLCYDDRDLLKEMVDTIANLICWSLDYSLPLVKPDIGWGWEDICFRTGPLISPDVFRKVALPGYQRIAAKLKEHGVDLYLIDSDGLIDDLLPIWIEGGVNVMFPIEIGAWKADPMTYRKKYGRPLRIIGGIDKLEIPKGREAIDAEISRRLPLMADGGFIPMPDHLITPDTPLSYYQYYLDKMRNLRF